MQLIEFWFISHKYYTFEDSIQIFRYIYKGRLVKISENIAFLFYKEIYMKYWILLPYKIVFPL
jgi:hypothetical protein